MAVITIAPRIRAPAEPLRRTRARGSRRRTGHTSTGYGVCNRPHHTRHRECPLCRGVEVIRRQLPGMRAGRLLRRARPALCARRSVATLPATMTAVQVSTPGSAGALQLRHDVPVPVVGPGEILVRNSYSGVNFHDTCKRVLALLSHR